VWKKQQKKAPGDAENIVDENFFLVSLFSL
jgi:hypothetical protein